MKKIVAFGEILLRLSPKDNMRICDTDCFDASYGGTESNVLVTLSGLGHKTEYVSIVPDNAFGIAAEHHLKRYGVGTSHLIKSGEIMGTYYLEKGFGKRETSVVYNRRHSEITSVNESFFTETDYNEIFKDCEIFHISGISFGLSEGCKKLAFKMIDEAKKRNITVSFDCNYRAKVFGDYPSELFKDIISKVNIVFCSQKDLDAMNIRNVAEFLSFDHCKYIIIREKKKISDDQIQAFCKVCCIVNGIIKEFSSDTVIFKVLESIGGGDAFDGAILHGLKSSERDITRSMEFALACYEMKHTVLGDVICVTENEVLNFIKNKQCNKGMNR